jgi:hypothetical protein
VTDFNVGPGMAEAMYLAGDEARSDEVYEVTTPDHQISRAYGRDAIYVYVEEDNRTNRLPFR